MTDGAITLSEAVQELYGTAVARQSTTSTKRLNGLAEYCVQRLRHVGLNGAETGVNLPGGARSNKWDVTWSLGGIVGRSGPAWGFGMIEAALVVAVDFSGTPTVLTPRADADEFFDALATQVKHRNPSLE